MNAALVIAMLGLLCVQVQAAYLEGADFDFVGACTAGIQANVDALKAQHDALDDSVEATCDLVIAMDPTSETPEQCASYFSTLDKGAAYVYLDLIYGAIHGDKTDEFCKTLDVLHEVHEGW